MVTKPRDLGGGRDLERAAGLRGCVRAAENTVKGRRCCRRWRGVVEVDGRGEETENEALSLRFDGSGGGRAAVVVTKRVLQAQRVRDLSSSLALSTRAT